ncbi:transposase [Escherichia coli]|uniref:Transposase n=1 Tax=Escherichia coli TaxID=562 RepID=A0A2X1MP02_ECOLX|nr:transposase [Escherichia coli]STM17197.1 transposase [Escherichia coli]
MELQDWRKEPRKNYSNEFKLRMVELASQPGACVAQIARENGVNDNVIFKWLRLWQNEGRVSRRLPVTTSSDTGVELLPVEITPDEQKEPVVNRPGFPGECFICELRLPDHRFRWKHNKLFLLLPEEYGPAFPAIVDCYTSPPT